MMMMREVEQRLSAAEVFERMMSSRAKPRLYPKNSKWRIDQAISLVGGACFAAHLDDFIGRWKPTPKNRSKTLGPTKAFDWSIRVWGLFARSRAHARSRTRERAHARGGSTRCAGPSVSERRAGRGSGSRREAGGG